MLQKNCPNVEKRRNKIRTIVSEVSSFLGNPVEKLEKVNERVYVHTSIMHSSIIRFFSNMK